MRFIITFFLILFINNSTYAQVRVYQYLVKSKFKMKNDNQPYIVTSTLNPVSYVAYNGGSSSIKVDLLKSWRCLGDTSQFKNLCRSPSSQLAEELNAAPEVPQGPAKP